MPTRRKVRRRLLETFPDLEGTLLELGAGWGSLVFPLAKRHPHLRIHAVELSWVPWLWMRLRYLLRPLPNLRITRADFFTLSLRHANGVVAYLYPEGMKRLRGKLEAELPPEACVLTHTFAVPSWQPEEIVYAEDLYRTPLYCYRLATAAIASPASAHAIAKSTVMTNTYPKG